MIQRGVAGVDGSPGAAAALTWAAGEARRRGAELVAWTILDQSGHSRRALRVAAEEAGCVTRSWS
ncbi:MAG: universal stress protein [Pseudonocardiaceae bacterium]